MAKGNARTPKTVVDIKEIPEVEQLLETEKKIQELIDSNPDFYKKLAELVEERNTYLQAAEKVVRASGVSCGPFNKLSETVDIDVEKLFDELGPDGFAEVGGYTEKVTTYKLDRTRFISHLEAGHVPQEVKETCVGVKRSYKKPETYKLP